jgi:6-phosphogluconolactonase
VSREVRIAANQEALMREAAEAFVNAAGEAVRASGQCRVVLAGGSTPQSLYTLLATDPAFRARVPWTRIQFFWGDERHVSPDHPDSNYRMAYEAMLSRVDVPTDHIHRIEADRSDAASAADAYERTLRTFRRSGCLFDLVLLGMGVDGHTASLFPGTAALQEQVRLVVANWVEKLKAHRITLTLPALNSATRVLFLVSGPDKAATLQAVFEQAAPAVLFPASLIRPSGGRLTWLVDQDAGRLLQSGIGQPGNRR